MKNEELKLLLEEVQDWINNWPGFANEDNKKLLLKYSADLDQLDAKMRDMISDLIVEEECGDWWKAAGENDE